MEAGESKLFAEEGRDEAGMFGPLVGNSVQMRQVFELTSKLAVSDATVLITGESGTGKELVARTVHCLSPRAAGPFVPVNCAALPEDLLESELFGHVRGAFTGAINARQGRFQLAHGGTLFLDEVGEMSPKLQVRLLRVLQEREFEPVGSDKAVRIDVRVVAAANRDLHAAVKERCFREDLFYRLNVLPISLPPLRERTGDISLLVTHFLRLHSRKKGLVVERLEAEALARLERYPWPGNVREVENLMERLVILNEDGVIRARDLPDYVCGDTPTGREDDLSLRDLRLPPEGVDLNGLIQTIEDQLILQALIRTGGNKTLAAELLRLNRTTLIERMRKKGLGTPMQQIPPVAPWASVRKVTADGYSLTA
ncbi:MAG: sigma 54-interacting transcriptional regulator [Deltaproteobacteria bacterium]|nr:sigma 54-interacting transcriptional regulator [Deltaproteobacteria bacterium]